MKLSLANLLSTLLVGLVCLPMGLASKDSQVDQHGFSESSNVSRTLHGKVFDIPFIASPFEASLHYETGLEDFDGSCNRPGFDAQPTRDPICQETDACHLGFTEVGDFLMYEFEVTEDHLAWDYYEWQPAIFLEVTIRVASNNPDRRVQLKIGNDLVPEDRKWPRAILDSPGLGFHDFEDLTWSVKIERTDISLHRLYVHFLEGMVNICAISVKPRRIIPFRAPALDFDEYEDLDSANEYNVQVCGAEKQGLVDAQPTKDLICQQRDASSCSIGWTTEGEYASYDFDTVDSEDYRVWARISSLRADKIVRVELQNRDDPDYDFNGETYSYEFAAPGLGWQEFVDVDFTMYLCNGRFRLVVFFEDGAVNLCSAGVDYMVHWSSGEYELPISWNALEYDYVHDSDPEVVHGNCPEPVPYPETDSNESQDAKCLESGPCYISHTEAGEFLRYDFADNGSVVDITVRVASNNANKRITLEVDGNRKTFETPGLGWNDFEDIVWENVQLRNFYYHRLYVVIVDGNVNICSISVEESS